MSWKGHEAVLGGEGGTFVSAPSGSAHSCLPKGAELNQTLVDRRANSTLPTGPDRGVW